VMAVMQIGHERPDAGAEGRTGRHAHRRLRLVA
jgi:hypothetical protein